MYLLIMVFYAPYLHGHRLMT